MSGTISTEQALIYTMVTMSGVEGKVNAIELAEIRQLVQSLPIFRDFDEHRLMTVAQEAGEILQEPEGLNAILGLVKQAYALAVEVAASDLAVGKEELRFLAMLRDTLGLDKLVTAAIERSAIARYQRG